MRLFLCDLLLKESIHVPFLLARRFLLLESSPSDIAAIICSHNGMPFEDGTFVKLQTKIQPTQVFMKWRIYVR